MDRGTYAAASGGFYASRRLEVVGNNLANVNTVGFKAQRLIARQQTFNETLASKLPDISANAQKDFEQAPGVVHVGTVTDFTPGPVADDGNPLHVALTTPNTFFVVQGAQGEVYTRAGNFTLDAERNLVTPDGLRVLGDGGPITLPEGDISISTNGTITAGSQIAGRLRTVQITTPERLQRIEGVRFRPLNAVQAEAVPAEVVPHSVEMPNVNVVEAMVEMINAQKSFEAYARSVRTIDEMNTQAIQSGRTTG